VTAIFPKKKNPINDLRALASTKNGKPADHFNEDLPNLEHCKFKQFIRRTKNVYITFVPKHLVVQIAGN